MKINIDRKQATFLVTSVLIVSIASLGLTLGLSMNRQSGNPSSADSGITSSEAGSGFISEIPSPLTSESEKIDSAQSSANGSSDGTASGGSMEEISSKVYPRIADTTLNTSAFTVITVSVLDYGAVPDDGKDDTEAIRSAIQATFSEFKGGAVFLPAGEYIVSQSIKVMSNVHLRGEWQSPDEGGMGKGTVIKAYYGKNSPDASALFNLDEASAISDLTVFYPEQKDGQITPYAPTLGNNSYLGSNYFNITLVNSYVGVRIIGHNALHIRNLFGTVLSQGIVIDQVYDIPRLDSIRFSAKYWTLYDKNVSRQSVEDYTRANLTGLDLRRIDWLYVFDCKIDGAKTGILFEASGKGASNGQISNLEITNSWTGLDIRSVSTVGHQISNSSIAVTGTGSIAVSGDGKFNGTQNVMFNSCSFSSEGDIASNKTTGVLVFNNCDFEKWAASRYAVNINAGGIVIDSCNFLMEGRHISLQKIAGVSFEAGLIVNNRFTGNPDIASNVNPSLVVIDNSTTDAAIGRLEFPEIVIPATRTAAKAVLFNAKDYGLVSDTTTDNTVAIQRALNAAGKNGGGIVYIETGRYIVDGYLVIPAGVELRGVNDYWKHFGASTKGTVLVTGYGKDKPFGNPFISLSAGSGISGLTVFYPDQNYLNNVVYSPTFQGMGDGCWIYNVNAPDSYNEVVMNCSGFHINYLRGIGLHVGLTIENSSGGFVQDLMLSGGDWQDGRRERNAPPGDLWKKFPNYPDSTAVLIRNSKNITLYQGFVFGLGTGIELSGKVEGFTSLGSGVDASANGIVLNHSGSGNTFINSQLVGSASYIDARQSFTGSAAFYNTNCWMNGSGDVSLGGAGKISIQVFKQSTGEFHITGSDVNVQNAYLDAPAAKIVIGADVKGGSFTNSIMGSVVPDYEDGSGGKFRISNILSK